MITLPLSNSIILSLFINLSNPLILVFIIIISHHLYLGVSSRAPAQAAPSYSGPVPSRKVKPLFWTKMSPFQAQGKYKRQLQRKQERMRMRENER
jgi:hypothetical protein